ncbi:MAG: PAS domain S-box protein [Bryobacterales bacterium]|nr:PAS domain S-box protein [Bryobacterales bacterium]
MPRTKPLRRDDVQKRLLEGLGQAQAMLIAGSESARSFEHLLNLMLDVTQSEYGFVAEALQTPGGQAYLRTHALTNIAWDEATRALYDAHRLGGMEFRNLNTLFGAVLRTGEALIANEAPSHHQAGGVPAGHPPLHTFLGLPLKVAGKLTGMIGVANRPGGYTAELVEWLEPFGAVCGGMILAYRTRAQKLELERERTAFFENSAALLAVASTEGQFLRVNQALCEALGYSAEELCSVPYLTFVHPDDLEKAQRHVGALVAGQAALDNLELRCRTKAGSYRWLSWIAPPAAPGSNVLFASARDVTREKELFAEVERLALVARRTNNAVVITDRDGRIEWVNEGFTRLSGYTLAEAVGRRPSNFLHGPQTDRSVVGRMGLARQSGRSFCEEVVNYRKDGQPYWVEIEVQPVMNEHGSVDHFMAVEVDITERKTAEKTRAEYVAQLEATTHELESARQRAEEASRAKSEFLAVMSHEIRTPMNGVLGMARLLLETDLAPAQREMAETVMASGESLLSILNDILDFSKIEAGRMDLEQIAYELEPVLESVVDLMQPVAEARGVHLVFWFDPALATHRVGDPMRLRQIVLNLVSNAIKFTSQGLVSLRAGPAGGGLGRLRIEVEDQGIGIPAEKLPRLFRAFTQVDSSNTRRFGGTGLGLAIVKQLAELMQGSVAVRSEVGVGSVFTVELVQEPASATPLVAAVPPRCTPVPPVTVTGEEEFRAAVGQLLARLQESAGSAPQLPPVALTQPAPVWPLKSRWLLDSLYGSSSASAAPPAAAVPQLRFSGLRVLLVEDNPVNQRVGARLLEQLGCQVQVACDGVEALIIARRDPFDLIFMDFQMPEMDGCEATRRLRASTHCNRGTTIVALTAAATESDRRRCLDAGMDGFLTKPVTPAALTRVLQEYTGKGVLAPDT